ncbi:lysoplasmalogenase [Cellulomonas humilata]|uniref:Membrane protein YhhN n=1 Tax=Cellulomonas humilata TaxID=144055 RepID=A0ABU0EEH3_9CELL|nr:lysoplasmalogenase [Cellulomonas humilata]MDQ0373668.1 putative membrane protein YhhN [Cellulomonas humilata]
MGRSLSMAARTWVAVFVVLVLVHLAAQGADATTLADVTQWMLMPALAAVVVTATRWPRGRVVTWTLVALGFSWLGDLVPSLVGEDAAFLVMVGFFLLAQVAYVVAFAPLVRRSVVHTRPVLLLPYAAVLVALIALCAPGADALLVPVAIYGGVLVAMAVLATGLGRTAAIGGAVFLLSDSLIALEAFVPWWDLAGQGFWVMLTYTVGQGLLAAAVIGRNIAERQAPEPRPVRTYAQRPPVPDNVVALV